MTVNSATIAVLVMLRLIIAGWVVVGGFWLYVHGERRSIRSLGWVSAVATSCAFIGWAVPVVLG